MLMTLEIISDCNILLLNFVSLEIATYPPWSRCMLLISCAHTDGFTMTDLMQTTTTLILPYAFHATRGVKEATWGEQLCRFETG